MTSHQLPLPLHGRHHPLRLSSVANLILLRRLIIRASQIRNSAAFWQSSTNPMSYTRSKVHNWVDQNPDQPRPPTRTAALCHPQNQRNGVVSGTTESQIRIQSGGMKHHVIPLHCSPLYIPPLRMIMIKLLSLGSLRTPAQIARYTWMLVDTTRLEATLFMLVPLDDCVRQPVGMI